MTIDNEPTGIAMNHLATAAAYTRSVAAQQFLADALPLLWFGVALIAVLIVLGFAAVLAWATWNPHSTTAAGLLRLYRGVLPWSIGGLVIIAGGFAALTLMI